jgi:WD40 repeat protein
MGIWQRLAVATLLTITGAQGALAQSATPEADIDVIDLDVDGRVLSISPDGAWLFGEGPDREACLWSVPDRDAICEGEVPGLDPDAIAWAPDGSAVAFSQQSARLMIDSDIYVMSVADGAITSLTDVTDENQQRIPLDGDGTSIIDVQPLWSDDGASITFIRSTFGEGVTNTRLARVDLDSGAVEEVFVLSPTMFLASYTPLFHAADGGILVSMAGMEPGMASNGIWKVAADGSRIDRVTAAPGPDEDGRYLAHDVSADGSVAIVHDIGIQMQAPTNPNVVPWALVDLDSGVVTPLIDDTGPSSIARIFGSPRFIAGSSDIVYLVQVDDDPVSFATGTGEPEILLGLPGANDRTPAGMRIAENGTVLVSWEDGPPTLYMTADSDDLDCATDDADGCAAPVPCGCTPPPSSAPRG